VWYRNDIHVQKMCNDVDELLRSCNIKSYLDIKGQYYQINLLKRPLVLRNLWKHIYLLISFYTNRIIPVD
jgi:hypothetical protein